MNINKSETFCISLRCEKKYQCGKNYMNLVNHGIEFENQVNMREFYVPSINCEHFIEFKYCDNECKYTLEELKVIKELLMQHHSFNGDVRIIDNLRKKTIEMINKSEV